MSVKDVISTHPRYEAVVKTARSFLSNPKFVQHVHMCNNGPMETQLATELLQLIDISAPGSAAANVHNYLNGLIDCSGRVVERGEDGVLKHLNAKVLEDASKSGIDLTPLYHLFTNWPKPSMTNIEDVAKRFMDLVSVTGVLLSIEDARKYAKEAIGGGAKSMDDATNYLNYVLGALNPSGYQVSMEDSIGHKRVLDVVTGQIEKGGLVRMEWQCRNYADEIFSNTPRGQSLSEHDIFAALQRIIYRESETARGIIAIGEKPDPFAGMSPEHKVVAEEVRRVLAAQGESWTMGKIREFARKLWDANAKNGWPTCEYIAEQVLVALEMGDTKQSITRNIGEAEVVVNSRYSGVDALNALISLENTALQEPVKAFEVDDHYRYTRNDVQFVIAREYGQSPEGNPLMGSWVIRNFFTGDYIDHDRHRTDLAERHAIKLES